MFIDVHIGAAYFSDIKQNSTVLQPRRHHAPEIWKGFLIDSQKWQDIWVFKPFPD
jgi:hypothetical protein